MLRRLYIMLLILCLSLNAQAQDSYDIKQLRQIAHDAYNSGDYEAVMGVMPILRAGDFRKESIEYGECMFFAYYCLVQMGHYADAIYAGRESLPYLKKYQSHDTYLTVLKALAILCDFTGDYQQAIELNTEVLNDIVAEQGRENEAYADQLQQLTKHYYALGDYAESIRLQTEVATLLEKLFGNTYPDYAMALNNLSVLNQQIGNYRDAMDLATTSLSIIEPQKEDNQRTYARILSNIAGLLSEIGDQDEAIRLAMIALDIKVKLDGKDHEYAIILGSIAAYFSEQGDYAKAIAMGQEALELRECLLGKEHHEYATNLTNLALDYLAQGDGKEAMRMLSEAMQIRQRVVGQNHPDYVESEIILGNIYQDNGDIATFAGYWRSAMEHRRNYMLDVMHGLSSGERQSFWGRYQESYETLGPDYAYTYRTPALTTCAYDGVLLYKGLLLNADVETRRT